MVATFAVAALHMAECVAVTNWQDAEHKANVFEPCRHERAKTVVQAQPQGSAHEEGVASEVAQEGGGGEL